MVQHKLEAAKEEFCQRNKEASEQRCRTVLQELWRDVELRLQRGDYVARGGAQLFKDDLNRVLEEYKQRPDKGVRVSEVWGSGVAPGAMEQCLMVVRSGGGGAEGVPAGARGAGTGAEGH